MEVKKFDCPGSMVIRQPLPEDYPCPQCGQMVEIWTNELQHKCPNCGTTVFREATPSCIDWCSYAKECVGEETYNRLKGIKPS